MADKYAFKTYGRNPDRDDDTLTRSGASKLRDDLKKAGHKAKVERSIGGDEHRVWIDHPTNKKWGAYVNREEAPDLTAKKRDPYWIAK